MRNAVLSLVAALVAFGAIDVPKETEVCHPIVATVDSPIPEGATFNGGWEASEGVYLRPVGEGAVHIWAKPGSHSVAFTGFWLHLKEISFKDGDGNTITIQSYLGHGTINEKAEFTVLGGTEPNPPGPQPGAKQLVFFVQADEMETLPEGQSAILNSLTVRKELASMGHVFSQVIDDDQIREAEIAVSRELDMLAAINAQLSESELLAVQADC